MGQQNGCQTRVSVWLVIFQPAHLGRGIAWQNGIADLADTAILPAKIGRYLYAFGSRAGVTPQFDRRQYLVICAQGYEAVLLSGYPDGLDTSFVRVCRNRQDTAPMPPATTAPIAHGCHQLC